MFAYYYELSTTQNNLNTSFCLRINMIPITHWFCVRRHVTWYGGICSWIAEARCSPSFKIPHPVWVTVDAADRLHINTVRLKFDVSGLHLLVLDYTELWGVRKDDVVAFLFQL